MSEPRANDVRAPQQARSRAALEKILVAAEAELDETGFDAFTMQGVASRAGVSIGAMYRRFTGREQLLDAVKDRLTANVEASVAERVQLAATRGLGEVLHAFASALAEAYGPRTRVMSEITRHQGAATAERAGESLRRLEAMFVDAATPHLADVLRPRPRAALRFVAQTCLEACAGKMAKSRAWSETESWARWPGEIAEMGTLYLTTPGTPAKVSPRRARSRRVQARPGESRRV